MTALQLEAKGKTILAVKNIMSEIKKKKMVAAGI